MTTPRTPPSGPNDEFWRDYLKALTGKAAPNSWEDARRLIVDLDFQILHPH